MSDRVEFTVEWLKGVEPEKGKQLEFYDAKLGNGFGVRVGGRSKTFFLSYRAGGRRRRYRIGQFPDVSLKVAREMAKKIDADNADPGHVREQERRLGSFAGLVKEFKEKYRDQVRPTTWKEYERQLDALVNGDGELEPWGDLSIGSITRGRVKDYLARKATTAPYAANRIRATLGKLFSWANEHELLDTNPVSKVKPQAKEEERDRVLSHSEIRKIWRALDREQLVTKAYFRMLFLTGLRRSEVLGARWEDLDLERDLWTVPRTATKSGFPLEVPITAAMRELFDWLRPLSGETPFVFASQYGEREPKPIVGTSKTKARIARRAGVEGWRVHDIRRTVTSNLAELGVADNVLRAVLGHRIAGALKHYQRSSYALQKREALERWQRKLREIVEAEKASVVKMA